MVRPMWRACVCAVVLGILSCGGESRPPARSPTTSPSTPIAQPPSGSEVIDFEDAADGAAPVGWRVDEPVKDFAVSTAPGPRGKALKVVVAKEGGGKLRRPLDLARYRGKRVRISAASTVTTSEWWARARVGIEVKRPVGDSYEDSGWTDRMTKPEWTTYEGIVDVAADATALDVVVTAGGESTAQVDDITLTIVGEVHAGDEAPRALTERGEANVIAFARLYGIVRYFHPSDEAAALDTDGWTRFVVHGVRAVEAAKDAAELATTLESLFAPIAPSVRIYVDGAAAPEVADAPADAIWWNHEGVGISDGSVYKSARGAGGAVRTEVVWRWLDVKAYRGKAFTIRQAVRATGDATADVGFFAYEERGDGQGFESEPKTQTGPVLDGTWQTVTAQGTFAADAEKLGIGVMTVGNADATFALPVVEVEGKALAVPSWTTKGEKLAAGWDIDSDAYEVSPEKRDCPAKQSCVRVAPRPQPERDRRPWRGALAGGVSAIVPLGLATANGHTAPVATAKLPELGKQPLLATDRATRLAAVIVGWNVFEHFYPYFDVVKTDWTAELPIALRRAAEDPGPAALHHTLRRMVAALHDGHGSVSHPGEPIDAVGPWLWETVEGRLVITQVDPSCACDLAPGDVVTSVDGVPTERAIADAAAEISAATPQFLDYNVQWVLRSGRKDARRRLTVSRAGAEQTIEVGLVQPAGLGSFLPERRPANGAEVAKGIRYVDMGITAEEWEKVLPDLVAADGVVFDARGYPGNVNMTTVLSHFTRTRIRSARWTVPSPTRPDREGMTFSKSDWPVDPAEPFIDNVVFLTDGRAVSAAETFMGIVEHYKLGEIVGGPTAGTNGNVNPFELPGGYRVWWTGMRVLKQDGSQHHGVGILPTVPAAKTIAGVAAGRDEILEKGIEVAQRGAKKAAKKPRRR
jgi:C-terminal processing protease CtpA/Prc